MTIEGIRRMSALYREQAEAVVLNGRWAAFGDEELKALDRVLWSAALGEQEFGDGGFRTHAVELELRAEIDRRGLDGHDG